MQAGRPSGHSRSASRQHHAWDSEVSEQAGEGGGGSMVVEPDHRLAVRVRGDGGGGRI